MAEEPTRREHGILRALSHPRAPLIIVTIGVVLRVGALLAIRDMTLDGDASSYHITARHLLGEGNWHPDWPPGLPAYLALGYTVFGAKVFVGRVLMLPLYVAFSAALFALTRRLSGVRAASLALAIFALSPAAVWNSVVPLSQLPAAALAIVVILLADRCSAEPARRGPAAWLGVALAALILTRPANLALLVIPAYLAYRLRRFQLLAIPTLIAACAIGGWARYASARAGYVVLINNANSQNIYYGNNPWTPLYRTWWFGSHKDPHDPTVPHAFLKDLRKINRHPARERDKLFGEAATRHIKDRPDLFVLRTFNRVRTFFGYDTFTSAQVAKESPVGGAVVLALDAATYLAVMVAALLVPTAWGRLRASVAADPGHPHPIEVVRILAVALLFAAAPYFVTFSHPTFHLPVVALAATLGAGVLVLALEKGLRATWEPSGRRARIGVAIALSAFAATQIEWTVHVLSRAHV